MIENFKVSVVVTCYNSSETIKETINSILDQSLAPLEIVVVDDGSKDKTVEILQDYGERIRLIVRENGGPSRARNSGIAECKGNWISFCDGDDLWHPEKLKRQITTASENPEIQIFATAWRRNREELKDTDPGFHIVDRKDLLRLNQFQTSTVLMKASVFNEVGTFDPNVDVAEDWEMWIRAALASKVYVDDAPLVMYRDSPKGVSKDLTTLFERSPIVMEKAYDSGGLSPYDRDVLLTWHRQRILIGQILTKNIRPATKMAFTLATSGGLTKNSQAFFRFTLPFLKSRASK